MTRKETNLLRREVDAMLKAEGQERLAFVKAVVQSNGARLI